MLPNEILSSLTSWLGPFKTLPQDPEAHFEKFQDLLKHTLTQSSLEFRKTNVQFPDFQQNMLPDDIADQLEKMTDEIIAAQANRKPSDPVFWLRQRNLPVLSGTEENTENFIEAAFSFGPFMSQQSKQSWFDFFQLPVQVKFQVAGIPDTVIITLPSGSALPAAGRASALHFPDCSIWVSAKTVSVNGDKKYAGIRAQNCSVTFSTIAEVLPTGVVSVIAPSFQISFTPFDRFANGIDNSAQPKAVYPDKIVFSFTGTKWVLQSFGESVIHINGDNIQLKSTANINPVNLEQERLIQFPLPAGNDAWEILNNNTERFRIGGASKITDTGWYLPVISTSNAAGTGILGMNIFSGYLGFRGKDGLTIDWPGLENGPLTISKFLLLGRPGRTSLKYTPNASARAKQQFATWKSNAGGDDRSLISIKPLPAADGTCINDNQQMESLMQPVNIGARVDRPLNTSQQRFDIADNIGALLVTKIAADTSVVIIGSHVPQPADVFKKRRVPQSLCLQNALLTTDNPLSIFVEGSALVNDTITQGFVYLIFPVYRLVNMLPDPYISNQDDIFTGQDFLSFLALWREGKDTLNDQFLFSVTAVVQWRGDDTSISFSMNQTTLVNRISDTDLFRPFAGVRHLCADVSLLVKNDIFQPSADITRLREIDPANVTGAFDFMQLLPGNRLLVDVSGSANLWGVSFSNNVDDAKKALPESVGFSARFPFRIKNMDLVSSGRMSRLFTLPHIQWEPVMKIKNPLVDDSDVPPVINFNGNGNPTRISGAGKSEVPLSPAKLYRFILDGFNNADKPQGIAANFTLPFGINACAYFHPKKVVGLPGASTSANEPAFSGKKTGQLSGAMQLHVQAIAALPGKIPTSIKPVAYFTGSAAIKPLPGKTISILGSKITTQFAEFAGGANAKVPLQRIDFSGYGASIFSNWHNDQANFGRVNQVKFDVLIGRTAHEVVQIKSILFPWGVPVVRSIVMYRTNTGIVTRYDSGWIAQGPGEFDFLSHVVSARPEVNPYNFHPGMVTGIYNVREIRDLPDAMDITFTHEPDKKILRFTGVYFNGDVQIENIVKGALPAAEGAPARVHSVAQWGYVMLADPALVSDTTTLADLFPPALFKQLLTNPKIGGSLGGPLNAVMNIASTGQRMQLTRVDVSASNEANPTFVVALRGTIELPKEGSWTVVKCLPAKDIVQLNPAEAVPVIRNGLLGIDPGTGERKVQFANSLHSLGDPAEIDKYAPGVSMNAAALQYSLLQTTATQKLLFRRPSFSTGKQQIFTNVPDLADAFRLLKGNTIFPNLADTLSLPDNVNGLNITGSGSGLKFDDSFFDGPVNLNKFTPRQLNPADPTAQVFTLIDESGFQVLIKYQSKDEKPSVFQADLSSDAIDGALQGERKKWQTVNKDVAIVVNLGSIKPLLTLRGTFRSEAGKDPVFEKPECVLGDELRAVKDILQVLGMLAGKGDVVADSLKVVMGNSPDSWNYKMSIEQRIPVIQFPGTEEITLSTPPPLIIEASLILGVFFNLSLSPDPKNLIRPGAGAVFGFEGMIQIQLITIGIAAAYGVGITKVKAYIDLTDLKPQFEFTFGFGATVIVDLPVVGLVSVTRSFSLTGNIDSGGFLAVAGQMLRGVVSLAGGLLIVAVQIEGKAGLQRKNADPDNQSTVALFEMIFSLDVSLAFVISYDFSKPFTEEITLS